MIYQKNIFLKQEADNWFDRNKSILKKKYEKSNQYHKQKILNYTALHVLEKSF